MNARSLPGRTTTLHRLRGHQFLSLKRPRGLCLRAERGTLWVTVDGELADIELAPGDSRIFDGSATVVVGTLGGDAVLSATAPAVPGLTRWLHAWLGSPRIGVRPFRPGWSQSSWRGQ